MANNFKKTNGKKDDNKKTFQKKKTVYVKKQLAVAYADFYAEALDSLYNLLSEITWDKVSVPVKMSRADLLGDATAKGSAVIASVVKFNNDNTFTISISEDNAKLLTDKHVMGIKCYKDRNSGEITYITELNITDRFESIDEHYKDIEEAFSDKDEDVEESDDNSASEE